MAKLIYSMITSLDGYAEAAEGDLGNGADDQEVHTFIGDLFRPVSARTSTGDGCQGDRDAVADPDVYAVEL